jgi:hypothetical protein
LWGGWESNPRAGDHETPIRDDFRIASPFCLQFQGLWPPFVGPVGHHFASRVMSRPRHARDAQLFARPSRSARWPRQK